MNGKEGLKLEEPKTSEQWPWPERMPNKSYNAQEIEQNLIRQIRKNSILHSIMEDSIDQASSLYMEEIEVGGDYNKTTAPPAISVLNQGGQCNDLDLFLKEHMGEGKKSNQKKHYRNIYLPIIVVSTIVVVFLAVILAVVVASTGKKSLVGTETIETHLSTPHNPAVPDASEKMIGDDFLLEGADEEQNLEEVSKEKGVCFPEIKFHDEFYPHSTPALASDGYTIVVKHGEKLKFYKPNRSHTYTHLSLPQTHTRSVNSNVPEEVSLAFDGSVSIMGDYMHDDEKGAVYVMMDNGESEHTNAVLIEAPDDVSGGGNFGYSVDIRKDRLIVGAPYGHGDVSGSVYVYKQTSEGIWELEDIFPHLEKNGSKDKFQLFGESVALHENVAAISGYNEFDEVTIFVYEYNPISNTWDEIDDIIVNKDCHHCTGVGLDVSFRDDGGLFISDPRKNEVSYLVPSLEKNGEYSLVQKIIVDKDGPLDMHQVEISGEVMAVGVTDKFANWVYVYHYQSDDNKWVKIDEIELPPNENFNPRRDFIDLALSRSSLIVSYGDDKLIWYTLDGCQ
jgi:hypothetical protein